MEPHTERELETEVKLNSFKITDKDTGLTLEIPVDLVKEYTDEDMYDIQKEVTRELMAECLECYYHFYSEKHNGFPVGLE